MMGSVGCGKMEAVKFRCLLPLLDLFVVEESSCVQLCQSMRMLLKLYRLLLVKFPIGSQALQTGILMGSGDLIAQALIEKKPLKNINAIRTGQFVFVGTFFVGPSLRVWYGILDKYFGNSGKVTALKKVAADQVLFAPAFLVSIMGILSAVQGISIGEIKKKISRDYLDVLVNNYKLWPAVQVINFYFIPLNYQVFSVQVVALFWNTYLSWKMNKL